MSAPLRMRHLRFNGGREVWLEIRQVLGEGVVGLNPSVLRWKSCTKLVGQISHWLFRNIS